jgi:hypothetical protein
MSKKFLTQHINQVFTHRKNSTEKKLDGKNAPITITPPNSQQNENAVLKEQQGRIAQEQLILKAKQAMTIRENAVYRLQQESANKERIVCEQLKKEKEQVEQRLITLRIEQEIVEKGKITLKLEQEQILLRIKAQESREQEAFKENQQIKKVLELEREQLVIMQRVQQEERDQLARARVEQEKIKEEINIPIQKLLVAEIEVNDEDYYIVPLAGEDNN